jgi:hypothetical protein
LLLQASWAFMASELINKDVRTNVFFIAVFNSY